MQTPREIFTRTLRFDNPERMPREIWRLQWAYLNIPDAIREVDARWPGDACGPGNVYRPAKRAFGDVYGVGTAADMWGCVFENILPGVHGEVKDAVLKDLRDWRDVVRAPLEVLPENWDKARDSVNRDCANTDKFVKAGTNPRPWEQYQFFRGSEDALVDMADPDSDVLGILGVLHEFYLRELEFWASTDVDCICFMDDWGSQRNLLIPPALWREIFKPMYREYVDIAHSAGKFAMMHSDGWIESIYPDLVEIGLDAVNSQLFVMDMEYLAKVAKGKLTFWGEMDRQHVLTARDPQVGRDAVRKVAKHFYDPRGGYVNCFEAGLGSNPATIIAICEEWDEIQRVVKR